MKPSDVRASLRASTKDLKKTYRELQRAEYGLRRINAKLTDQQSDAIFTEIANAGYEANMVHNLVESLYSKLI